MKKCIRYKNPSNRCPYSIRLAEEYNIVNTCDECEYNANNIISKDLTKCKFCESIKDGNNVEYDIKQPYTSELYVERIGNSNQIRIYGESPDPSILFINYCPICGRKLK